MIPGSHRQSKIIFYSQRNHLISLVEMTKRWNTFSRREDASKLLLETKTSRLSVICVSNTFRRCLPT